MSPVRATTKVPLGAAPPRCDPVALPEVATPVAALDDPAVWLPADPAVSDALEDPVAGC